MSTEFEVISLSLSIFLSAFFSCAEAALMSLPHEKAKQIADEHGLDSVAIKHWVERPNDFITTILVGNNLVNIFIASLSTAITQRHFDNDALAISVGLTTIVILIFGEIVPKTFGRNF